MEIATTVLTTTQINHFFKLYENRVNDSLKGEITDVDGVVNSFAECFVEASPRGVLCSHNDRKFRKAIPKGYEFYKRIGIISMNIISKEMTILNELHAIVKVHWKSIYRKKEAAPGVIEFDVYYLLQLQQDQPKIFAYIAGDEQQALKEHGLIS